MPNQAWGKIGETPFYFRGRHGEWSLCLGVDGGTLDDAVNGLIVSGGDDEIGGEAPGYWEADDLKKFVTEKLQEYIN